MEAQKAELEKRVSVLTAIYSEMLIELAKQYDLREAIKKQLEQEEANFNNTQIIADCVFGRLNEAKKTLNAVYNNEDPIPMGRFIFAREMVKDAQEEKII